MRKLLFGILLRELMADATLFDLVKSHFGYLITEYGHTVQDAPYGSEPFSDRQVIFSSPVTTIIVVIDRTQVIAVMIRPTSEPDEATLSLKRIIEFLVETKRAKSPQIKLGNGLTIEERVTEELKYNAWCLRTYCEENLRGDFSWWLEGLTWLLELMKVRGELPNVPSVMKFKNYIEQKTRAAKRATN